MHQNTEKGWSTSRSDEEGSEIGRTFNPDFKPLTLKEENSNAEEETRKNEENGEGTETEEVPDLDDIIKGLGTREKRITDVPVIVIQSDSADKEDELEKDETDGNGPGLSSNHVSNQTTPHLATTPAPSPMPNTATPRKISGGRKKPQKQTIYDEYAKVTRTLNAIYLLLGIGLLMSLLFMIFYSEYAPPPTWLLKKWEEDEVRLERAANESRILQQRREATKQRVLAELTGQIYDEREEKKKKRGEKADDGAKEKKERKKGKKNKKKKGREEKRQEEREEKRRIITKSEDEWYTGEK